MKSPPSPAQAGPVAVCQCVPSNIITPPCPPKPPLSLAGKTSTPCPASPPKSLPLHALPIRIPPPPKQTQARPPTRCPAAGRSSRRRRPASTPAPCSRCAATRPRCRRTGARAGWVRMCWQGSGLSLPLSGLLSLPFSCSAPAACCCQLPALTPPWPRPLLHRRCHFGPCPGPAGGGAPLCPLPCGTRHPRCGHPCQSACCHDPLPPPVPDYAPPPTPAAPVGPGPDGPGSSGGGGGGRRRRDAGAELPPAFQVRARLVWRTRQGLLVWCALAGLGNLTGWGAADGNQAGHPAWGTAHLPLFLMPLFLRC